MKAIEIIKEFLKGLSEGEPFTSSELRHLASADNIRQILNRLVKQGELVRLRRGVFAKPKYVKNIGETLPLVSDIAEAIAKGTGETIVIHGAEAARQLGLTTQVPMRLVFYTSGYTRDIKVKNQSILLKHISPSKLIAPGTVAGTVITALNYLGREKVTYETLQIIENQLNKNDFYTLYDQATNMPAWMANLFYHFKRRSSRG